MVVVIEAMKRSQTLRLSYSRYGSGKVKSYLFEPYCLKMHRQRWYVLGRFMPADKVNVISLDRIVEVELTSETFALPEDFDAESFFRECYGVIVDDGTEAETVVIRVRGMARYYIEDLPLHEIQRLIRQGKDYSDYEYYLRPTIDFFRVLMGWGDNLVVLLPEEMGEMLKEWHLDSAEAYEEIEAEEE